LGIPFAALFVFIVRWAGPGYFITYVYSFMLAVTVIAIVIFPIIIQPLFNKFTPLPDGELKEKLCALCNTVSFPVKKLFVVDGSTRSSHSNAYVFGLFKLERIVLYDTLVNSLTTDEIISVVGHELGHWKLGHFYRNIIASQLHTLLLLYLSEKFLFSKDLYVSFGFPANTEAPVLVGM
jgi:STE24 endopeptidase